MRLPAVPWRRAARGLARDRRGATAVEFAVIAPALCLTLLGLFDMGYNLYAKTLLEGAMQKAARDSSIEGAGEEIDEIDARVRRAVQDLVPQAHVDFERESYANFSGVSRPEDFTDVDGNGDCNDGEPFEDANGNGVWDLDRGDDGIGGARDAVSYTVTVTYDRVFPLAPLIGLPPTVTLAGHTVLRNQPYGPQNPTATIGNCT